MQWYIDTSAFAKLVKTEVDEHLAALSLVSLTPTMFDDAGRLHGAIRSLDAIHVVAALELGDDLDGIITYDTRLTDVATTHGITVVTPT